MQLPLEDKYTYKKSYVEGQISILMGGRIAEELTQEDITTGAGNDIDRATDLARRMVREWGMSELGPLSYGNNDEPVFLGRDFSTRPDYSEDTAIRIDREVDRIVQASYERAKAIVTEHRPVLDRLAHELLELESLEGRQVYEIIREMTGEELGPPADEQEPEKEEQEQPAAAREAEEQPAREEVDTKASRPRPAPTDPLPSTE
jgi:cell division protease FtsH